MSQDDTIERPETHEAPSTVDALAELEHDMDAADPGASVVTKVDAGLGPQRGKKYYDAMPQRIEDEHKRTESEVDNLEKELTSANLPDGMEKELSKMFETLRKDTVKAGEIRTHQDMLEKYMSVAATEEQRALLGRLHRILGDFLQNTDPLGMQIEDYNKKRRGTPLNKETAKLGRLALVLAGGVMTIFTGFMAIFGKKFSAAPLIYGGITYFALQGRDIFKGKAAHDVEQAAGVVKAPTFIQLGKHFGPAKFKEFVQNVRDMQDKGPLATAVKKQKLTDEQRGELLDELVPAPAFSVDDRAMVQELMKGKPFGVLLESIWRARNVDVRTFIDDYIDNEAWKFEK